jgi:hypothetical protein
MLPVIVPARSGAVERQPLDNKTTGAYNPKSNPRVFPRRAFKSLFAQAFQPGLVLVSAGFDATAGHPAALGGYSVSPACFGLMTTSLLQAVGGKVGSVNANKL